ncbi:MAG: FKBP-type peptidyl-prolyl cis-trans isomerase [Bacteroidales bacterium]|nr:FKBP-type peptidyl-prolyl cis-trans isomerase [Bacteroidales bacterium]MBP5518034.1 FKBP-type peptidyl-prolyl cis-trans isomerase [Bacteroidales bacterium]
MVRNLFIICLAAVFAIGCDKEDRKNTYADQESRIDAWATSQGAEFPVVLNSGVVRVVVTEGSGSELQKGDSLYFHYSGYVFSNGKGGLFYTNDPEVAEETGFITDGKPIGIKYGSSALLKGLSLGLEGVKEGEHCYIVFSARYGYGNQIIANLPKLTPLFFDIKVDKILK